MAETVPNAFMLLLGQIGLFMVGLFFGMPLSFATGAIQLTSLTTASWVFIYVMSVASTLMVANIIIGWNAVKFARETLTYYSPRLFTADLFVIFIFFSMNNVIIYALGAGFSAFDPSSMISIFKKGISINTSSITLGTLMVLSASYLTVCLIWNAEFHKLSETDPSQKYELRLAMAISGQLLLGIIALLTPGAHTIHVAICTLWLVSWAVINIEWISSNFVK